MRYRLLFAVALAAAGARASNVSDQLSVNSTQATATNPRSGNVSDNLAATFSPELVDATIYVIDVAEGEKIPRKGGPGITRSDLLVINKIDLAPHVGADLGVMERDARRQRGARPFVFTNLRSGEGVDAIVAWLRTDLLLALPV